MSFNHPLLDVARDVMLIIRQSTKIQKRDNPGSGELQLSLLSLLANTWPGERIITVDARGESGSRGKRELIQKVLNGINSGLVGTIAFMRGDRLGRTALESEEILRAAVNHKVLIITEGRIYNPASATDKLMLSMMSSFAEYENNARTVWLLLARGVLARRGAFRVVLPTGLISGSPEDPEFVKKLSEAGLEECLSGIGEHKAISGRGGLQLYVLPFPDRDVHKACKMRMDCMLAKRDLGEVIRMINQDPDYPRPGLIPITKAVRRYHSGIKVRWIDVNHPYGRAALKKWFRSPALYGTYAYRSPRSAELNPSADPESFDIRIENAFVGFAPAEEEERVREVLARDTKPWREGSYDGIRRHALSMLLCGHVEADGTRCEVKLGAMYQNDGWYGYYSHGCRFGTHKTQHIDGQIIDRMIIDTLMSAFDQKSLRAAVQALKVDQSAAKARFNSLEAEIERLEVRIKAASELAVQAKIDGSLELQSHFNSEVNELIGRRGGLQRELFSRRADLEDFLTVAAADRDKIVELGGDLRRLIPLTRENHPALLRALMDEMVDRVYFTRISGFACEIELVFPGGAWLKKSFMTRRFNASRAALEFAAGKLNEGRAPEEIADALNATAPKNHKVPWDTERVRTAPYVLKHQEQPELRSEAHRSVDEIARESGVEVLAVQRAAFAGDLGPGFYRDGSLQLAPSKQELHRWLPEIAKRDVAAEMGWDVQDVISRAEASRLTGRVRGTIVGRAQRRGRLGVDATGEHWVLRSDFPGPGPLPRKRRAPNKKKAP
jgi:hypothetical protein